MTALHLAIDKMSYEAVSLILQGIEGDEKLHLLNHCGNENGVYLKACLDRLQSDSSLTGVEALCKALDGPTGSDRE